MEFQTRYRPFPGVAFRAAWRGKRRDGLDRCAHPSFGSPGPHHLSGRRRSPIGHRLCEVYSPFLPGQIDCRWRTDPPVYRSGFGHRT
jgi:hypothetical protein